MSGRLCLVGIKEIAALAGVKPATVYNWRDGRLPDPEWVVSGTPVWREGVILRWLRDNPVRMGRWAS